MREPTHWAKLCWTHQKGMKIVCGVFVWYWIGYFIWCHRQHSSLFLCAVDKCEAAHGIFSRFLWIAAAENRNHHMRWMPTMIDMLSARSHCEALFVCFLLLLGLRLWSLTFSLNHTLLFSASTALFRSPPPRFLSLLCSVFPIFLPICIFCSRFLSLSLPRPTSLDWFVFVFPLPLLPQTIHIISTWIPPKAQWNIFRHQ